MWHLTFELAHEQDSGLTVGRHGSKGIAVSVLGTRRKNSGLLARGETMGSNTRLSLKGRHSSLSVVSREA